MSIVPNETLKHTHAVMGIYCVKHFKVTEKNGLNVIQYVRGTLRQQKN